MEIKIAKDIKENGIVAGNFYDKYNSKNPLVKLMVNGFKSTLSELIRQAAPCSIHEIGCGEGYWVLKWTEEGLQARGSDFSTQVIAIARENAQARSLSPILFECCSIYDLDANQDSADLVVCCEVLEHLTHPEAGLQALQSVVLKHLIVSVPREPLWCALNLVRGKYIDQWGNTPGHLQHWSKNAFIQMVTRYFDILEVRSPLPWTMLLCRPRNHV